MNRIRLPLSTALLGCAVMVQPAFAEDTSAPAAASASNQPSKDSQILEEIVITAERRISTAQKTAASVSVRSGEDLLTEGRYELKDILEDVPGVVGGAATSTSSTRAGGTDNPASGLTIRGVQSNGGGGGSITSTAAAAAIYVDDVFSGIGGGYNIDRVEVLRGPQGTLYGRSATSGVVAIHTREPDATVFSAEGTVEGGNYDLRHYTGDVNLPLISDQLALRLSGNLAERDGYYSAQGDARKNTDFRAKALWTPTDNFTALFGYALEDILTHTGGVAIGQVNSPSNFVYTPVVVGPTGKNDSRQYWGNFNLELGPVAITYIPAYRTWYGDTVVYGRGVFSANQTLYTPTDWFMTHELRIRNTDNDSNLTWQAGFLYYDNSLSNVNNLFLIPVGPYAFKSDSHKTTSAEGVFAQATYAFAPDTRLTTGIRFDHTRTLNTEDYSAFGGPYLSLTGDEGLRTFNNVTYKVRLEHDLTPQNLLYAAISTGFSPGDVTITTNQVFQPQVQVLQAETLTAYEIGSKNRFLDSRLPVNGDIYYNDYGAYQTAGINTNPSNPAMSTFSTLSAPMRSHGAELEVLVRPWENGAISFNASYTDARYGSFGQYQYLFSKSEVPGVAPFQGTLAYDHRIPIGSATLELRGDVRFFTGHDTSSIPVVWAQQGAAPYVHVASQAIGDFNSTLWLGPHYGISAYVRNITDDRFIPDNWVVTSAGPVTSSGSFLSDPRTFGMILTFKY